jgi:prepilin-type N-terminal cleavage/methylation domain-containing protein
MKRKAFTLIEVLIALSISLFIMLFLTRYYTNVIDNINKNRTFMRLNKKVYVLFDQLEKDFSTAFIPRFEIRAENNEEKRLGVKADEKKIDDKKGKESSKKEVEKKTIFDKKKEKEIPLFKIDIYEGETGKVGTQKFELFRLATFINTNPLLVYEKNKPRIVRVMYELVKDKEKSRGETIVYNLYRYETANLSNFDFEKSDYGVMEKAQDAIYTNVVAQNVKDMYMRCVTLKHKDFEETDRKDKKEYEQVMFFEWGKYEEQEQRDKKKQIQENERKKVPQRVEIMISFWDDALKFDETFECSIPILSFALDDRPIQKKKLEQKSDAKKKDDKKKK